MKPCDLLKRDSANSGGFGARRSVLRLHRNTVIGVFLSAAISAAYLLSRRRGIIGVTPLLQGVGVTCVTVVEKRGQKRVKNIAYK